MFAPMHLADPEGLQRHRRKQKSSSNSAQQALPAAAVLIGALLLRKLWQWKQRRRQSAGLVSGRPSITSIAVQPLDNAAVITDNDCKAWK